MPQDLLRAAGTSSLADRLTLVMDRLRTSGTPPRSDVETTLQRTFWLPTSRTFSLTGQARISPLIPDDEIDRVVGRPGSDYSGTVAYSLGRLPNDLRANAMATLDNDPATVWEPGFGVAHQAGQWLQYELRTPLTFDHLDLQVVADGRHSVPTRITVSTESGQATVDLPPLADSSVAGGVVDVPVDVPDAARPQHQDHVRRGPHREHARTTTPRPPSPCRSASPRSVFPGVTAAAVPAQVPYICRGDLISVDGAPLWVQVTGSTADALDRKALTISLCGPDAHGVTLGPGDHTLRSAVGRVAAFDVDQLAFDSAPGGGPMPLAGPTTLAPPAVASSPPVVVDRTTATSVHLTVSGVGHRPGYDALRPHPGRVAQQGLDGHGRRRAEPGQALPGGRLRQRLAGRPGRRRALRPRRSPRGGPGVDPAEVGGLGPDRVRGRPSSPAWCWRSGRWNGGAGAGVRVRTPPVPRRCRRAGRRPRRRPAPTMPTRSRCSTGARNSSSPSAPRDRGPRSSCRAPPPPSPDWWPRPSPRPRPVSPSVWPPWWSCSCHGCGSCWAWPRSPASRRPASTSPSTRSSCTSPTTGRGPSRSARPASGRGPAWCSWGRTERSTWPCGPRAPHGPACGHPAAGRYAVRRTGHLGRGRDPGTGGGSSHPA